jgi:hypothetical protein
MSLRGTVFGPAENGAEENSARPKSSLPIHCRFVIPAKGGIRKKQGNAGTGGTRHFPFCLISVFHFCLFLAVDRS